MADRFTREERRRIMQSVRTIHTKPELEVRSKLHRAGFRYSLHRKDLPGKPDLVLPKYATVVFVHGCFWHGHDCPRGKRPATRKAFWDDKLSKNKERDARNKEALEARGWNVAAIWECRLEEGTSDVLENLRRLRAAGRRSP